MKDITGQDCRRYECACLVCNIHMTAYLYKSIREFQLEHFKSCGKSPEIFTDCIPVLH